MIPNPEPDTFRVRLRILKRQQQKQDVKLGIGMVTSPQDVHYALEAIAPFEAHVFPVGFTMSVPVTFKLYSCL